MPTTLDPQEERQHLDDLESNFKAPAAQRRDPVSADELERQYNLPAVQDRQNKVYDDDGVQPSTPQADKKGGKDGKELKEDEESARQDQGDSGSQSARHENQIGSGYKVNSSSKGFIRSQLGKQNRAWMIGGGGLIAAATIAIFIFLALAPLKIMHIVNNLQNHFYATSESAVQNETDVLFSGYLRTRVMPALRRCPGEVTKKCNPIQQGGLVSQLYNGWRNAGLEQKLATNYGIEFRYTQGHYYIKMPGMTGEGANLDNFVHPDQQQLFSLDEYMERSNDPQWKKVGRAELRRSYRDALAKETKWKQLFYRYKVAGLLSKKYGLKRCIIACDRKDNFADWKDNKAKVAKMIIAERVLKPRNEALALVIQCVIDGDCHKTQEDSDGQERSKIQRELDAKLAELALEDTGKYASVLAHSDEILKNGYQKYILQKVTKKLLNKELSDKSADTALKAVPVLGWVNAGSELVTALEEAPQGIKMASYLVNGGAMVSLYGTYRIYTDEIKTGHIDSAMLGSFTDTLGAGQPGDIGGSASAEESPLYQNLIDGKTSSGSKVICADGKPIPGGKLVCSEEVLGGNSSVTGPIQSIIDSPEFKPIVVFNGFWKSTIGRPFRIATKLTGDALAGTLGRLPGFNKFLGYIGSAVSPVIDAFTKFIVPSPFGMVRGSPDSDNQSSQVSLVDKLMSPVLAADDQTSDYMTGGRVFDLMAGGADVSGNDYAHNGLGGQSLTPEQTASIINQQLQQSLQSYQSQPLMARLFDKDSEYSLMTKLAMAMPSTKSGMLKSLGGIFTNPFAKMSNVFGFLFNPMQTFAADSPQPDPFGVTQYGYSANDPTLAAANKDPEAYWDKNCSSDGKTIDWKKPINAKWQANGFANAKSSATGTPENTTTNPCLLLQATVGSAGGLYDDSLLGDDQPGAATTSDTTASPTSSADTTIDTANLNDSSSSLGCAPGTNDLNVQDGFYNGKQVEIRVCAIPGLPSSGEESTPGQTPYIKNANGLAIVNARVSGAVLAMVQAAAKAGVRLSAGSSFRTMAHQQCLYAHTCGSSTAAQPGYSNHQMGLAIDFSVPQCNSKINGQCSDPGNAIWDWLNKNAATFGYKSGVPDEAWHWSPSGN